MGEPTALAKYVLPERVQRFANLPGPSGAGTLERLEELYQRLAAIGVEYAHEAPSEERDRQVIRSPEQVLWAPRHGTCLDLAVTLAAAGQVAGLHPIVIILGGRTAGDASHAVVGFWRGESEFYPPSRVAGVWTEAETPDQLAGLLAADIDDHAAALLVVDPVGFAHPLPGTTVPGTNVDLADAVRAGAAQVTSRPWRLAVDIHEHWRVQDQLLPAEGGVIGWTVRASAPPQTPTRLLREEHTVVPFTGRAENMHRMREWAITGPDLRIAVLTGAAGQGKSRLARRLGEVLRREQWQYGALRRRFRGFESYSQVTSLAHPSLIAVDYAETRTVELDRLFEQLSENPVEVPLRVLLVARARGRWWTDLKSLYGEILDEVYFEDLRDLPLANAANEKRGDRLRMYEEARNNLAQGLRSVDQTVDWESISTTIPPPTDLQTEGYSTPLAIQMSVLLSLLNASKGSRPKENDTPLPGTIDQLLVHEKEYWARLAKELDLKVGMTLIDRAVATATIFGAGDHEQALRILGRIPGIDEGDWDQLRKLDRFVEAMFPPDASAPQEWAASHWGSLQPDLLGEWHAGEVTKSVGDLVASVLNVADGAQIRRAEEILARVVPAYPHLRSALEMIRSEKQTAPSSVRRPASGIAPVGPAHVPSRFVASHSSGEGALQSGSFDQLADSAGPAWLRGEDER